MTKRKSKEAPMVIGALCPICGEQYVLPVPPWNNSDKIKHENIEDCMIYFREIISGLKSEIDDLRLDLSEKAPKPLWG